MHARRTVPWIIAGASLLFSSYLYSEHIWLLGFPDGFISPLQGGQYHLAWILIGACALLCIGCVKVCSTRALVWTSMAVLLIGNGGLYLLLPALLQGSAGG
jgi:hypothetical protein